MIATASLAVSPPVAAPPAVAAPRLLDQVRQALQARRYNPRTEEIFVEWTRRYVVFHGKRHPAQMAEPEVARFLSHLATEEHVSLSVQTQARAALVFLYRHVLDRPLRSPNSSPTWPSSAMSAPRPKIKPSTPSCSCTIAYSKRISG